MTAVGKQSDRFLLQVWRYEGFPVHLDTGVWRKLRLQGVIDGLGGFAWAWREEDKHIGLGETG